MDNEEEKSLAELVMEWWEEHQCDTDGGLGGYKVYDYEPAIVVKAMKILGLWKESDEH